MRTITLPAIDRTISLGSYLQGIRKAKANPDARFPHGLTCWWSCSGAEIMRQFRQGVHERINAGIPYSKRGMS